MGLQGIPNLQVKTMNPVLDKKKVILYFIITAMHENWFRQNYSIDYITAINLSGFRDQSSIVNLTPFRFFCDNSKSFWARKLNCLTFLTNTSPHLRLNAGLLYLLPESSGILPYFTYTRLNTYLDLLPVSGFQNCIALWKACNKSKQIAKILQKIYTDFCTGAFKGNFHILVFLE